MKQTRKARRREAAINSVKVILTSASLAATLGGWAVISMADTYTAEVAEAPIVLVDASAAATPLPTTVPAEPTLSVVATQGSSGPVATAEPTNIVVPTVAPTATAVPTQVVVQPHIRTRSSN